MKTKIKKNGFTLLELVIVMAMIMIMTVVSLVFLGNNKKNKELEAAARAVSAAIREAQNNALAGKQLIAGEYPCSFSFEKISGSSFKITYKYHLINESTTACATNPAKDYVTYYISNGVTLENFTSFNFGVPFGEVGGISTPPLAIVLTKSSTNYVVCINSRGNVCERPNTNVCDADSNPCP